MNCAIADRVTDLIAGFIPVLVASDGFKLQKQTVSHAMPLIGGVSVSPLVAVAIKKT